MTTFRDENILAVAEVRNDRGEGGGCDGTVLHLDCGGDIQGYTCDKVS